MSPRCPCSRIVGCRPGGSKCRTAHAIRDAQPSVDRSLVNELGTLRFLEDATNVLFIGPPGVGKTMLAVALGRAAVEAGYRTSYTTAAERAARCHRAADEGYDAGLHCSERRD